jgi:murein L,D-transpeptidase YcbB/YkuD
MTISTRTIRGLLGLLLLLSVAACSGAPSLQRLTSAKLKKESLATRITSMGDPAKATVHGDDLLQGKTVVAFYEARQGEPAWALPDDGNSIRKAIEGIAQDGLTPADYHLAAIDSLLATRKDHRTEEGDADLEVLLTDAVAGMIDHARYGRVRPASLDKRWNVDSRKDAPPLVDAVARVAQAPDKAAGIEGEKLDHFIYKGLKDELARVRGLAEKGGWSAIPSGAAIKPGSSDPRVAQVRARLASTGELPAEAAADSGGYEGALVDAVKLFQERHRLGSANGVIDAATLAELNIPTEERANQVRVNLERARWVLPGLQGDFLLVNLPAFKTYLIQGGQKTWESRIQVGKEGRQTPSFRTNMKYVVFNPTWTVPSTILKEDIIASKDGAAAAIARKNLHVYDRDGNEVDPSSVDWSGSVPYTLRQNAGDDNALGQVKFMFPNPYDVYLHDTPHRELFAADRRTFSSGCMRLENPMELVKIVLGDKGYDDAKIAETIASGKTQQVNLSKPLPVVIVYWTVTVGVSGEVRYNPDIYGNDPAVLRALQTPERVALR